MKLIRCDSVECSIEEPQPPFAGWLRLTYDGTTNDVVRDRIFGHRQELQFCSSNCLSEHLWRAAIGPR